jgi:uncharacterized LabA/DUF88 family protein
MKIMIFVDHQNFCQSLWAIDGRRQEKVSGLSNFIMEHLNTELKWDKYIPRLIRSYVYTGEYAETTISKIKHDLEKSKQENSKFVKGIEKTLDASLRRQEGQKKAFEAIKNNSTFLEIRTKPLQYSKGRIFQKGIDVQLAVDLVSHAYIDSYDAAVVCSGDVDLIESIKLVKNLGKKVIVVSHPENTASQIFKECDYYIDLSKLNEDQLNQISHLVGTEEEPEV